jgi:hypothetical protein
MMAFGDWILAQRHRDDHIGDFAREMAAELWLQLEKRNVMEVKMFLLNLGVSVSTLEAFADAVMAYIKEN